MSFSISFYALVILLTISCNATGQGKPTIRDRPQMAELTMPYAYSNVLKPSEFPYVVSIQANFSHWCGGALISDQHVLSCAHCWVNEKNNSLYNENVTGPLTIKAGVNNLNDPKYYYAEVKDIWILKAYNASLTQFYMYDIAVLKLKTKLDITKSPNVRIVNLPSFNSSDSYLNKYAEVAGYGNTTYIGSPNFYKLTRLNYLVFKIWNINKCKNVYSNIRLDAINHICAYVPRRDGEFYGACNGDSGSPMVINNTVIGIVSSAPITPYCGYSNLPAIFTRVSSWINFIEDAMNERYNQYVIVKQFP